MAKQSSSNTTSNTPTKRKAKSEAPAALTETIAKASLGGVQALERDGLEPTHERIAARAFELYQQRGGANGSELSDWLTAERELRN